MRRPGASCVQFDSNCLIQIALLRFLIEFKLKFISIRTHLYLNCTKNDLSNLAPIQRLCGKCGPDNRGRGRNGRVSQQAVRAGVALALTSAALAMSTVATAAGESTASLGGSSRPADRPVYLTVGEPTRAPIG